MKEAQFRPNYKIDFVDLGLNRNQVSNILSQAPLDGSYRVTENMLLLESPRDAETLFGMLQFASKKGRLCRVIDYIKLFADFEDEHGISKLDDGSGARVIVDEEEEARQKSYLPDWLNLSNEIYHTINYDEIRQIPQENLEARYAYVLNTYPELKNELENTKFPLSIFVYTNAQRKSVRAALNRLGVNFFYVPRTRSDLGDRATYQLDITIPQYIKLMDSESLAGTEIQADHPIRNILLAKKVFIAGDKVNIAPRDVTKQKAKELGEKIGINWDEVAFDVEQFERGIEVEFEHGSRDLETDITGDNLEETAKIAWAHLKEMSDYYDELAKMERQGINKKIAQYSYINYGGLYENYAKLPNDPMVRYRYLVELNPELVNEQFSGVIYSYGNYQRKYITAALKKLKIPYEYWGTQRMRDEGGEGTATFRVDPTILQSLALEDMAENFPKDLFPGGFDYYNDIIADILWRDK